MQPAEENTALHEELPHTQWKYMEMHPASGKTHFRGRDTFEKRQNSNKCYVCLYMCACNCVVCVVCVVCLCVCVCVCACVCVCVFVFGCVWV